ncbi:XdhC family protein [Brevibacillus sp. B_LB10_24]|uniref:XdhC family protein n=1 Tax=Brevibacillus sp. B_LB10_24 TaxID=3380645 RepID=UPI0038BB2007
MRENVHVVRAIEEARKAGKQAALATVVRVFGSAYRREGAKMVTDEDGGVTGMISGGCLEADVAEVAKNVIQQGRPVLKRYDLDEDLVWGLGLGCPGTVEVFIESVPAGEAAAHACPLTAWLECLMAEGAGVLATVLEDSSRRLFVAEEGSPIGGLGDETLQQQVVELARQKLSEQSPRSQTRELLLPGGKKEVVFLDVHVPAMELMIFGAGHDAIPLAKASLELGMKTTVVDPRPGYNTADRFPGAERILANAETYGEQVSIGRRTYVIVMNHHLERDQEALRFALQSKAPYVGVLGPRSRSNRMLEALERAGAVFRAEELARMFSPVGLDIGADSPEEIAVSIMAEVLAFRSGHAAGFLRERPGIHQPAAR